MDNDVYFPARGNVAFFDKRANQVNLISRIKHSILMFDNIHFDAGAYILSSSDRGAIDSEVPPEIAAKLKIEVPDKPMTSFGVKLINEQTGKEGTIISPGSDTKSYFVNFHKIINDLGLSEQKFIQFKIITLNQDGKRIINEQVRNLDNYKRYIEGNSFHQKYILKNICISLMNSLLLKTPMMVDALNNNLLHNMPKTKISDARIEILKQVNELLKFNIPDFSTMDIDKLLDLRQDKLFISFRNKLVELNKTLIKDPKEIDLEKIKSLFVKELIDEMKEMAPSGMDLFVNGILGLAGPLGTGVSIVKDGTQLLDFKSSWLAFIMKNTN